MNSRIDISKVTDINKKNTKREHNEENTNLDYSNGFYGYNY